METFTYILMIFLVVCAVAVSLSKKLLNSILIFMSYSLVMSIIWMLLESRTWPLPRPPWGPASPASCSCHPEKNQGHRRGG